MLLVFDLLVPYYLPVSIVWIREMSEFANGLVEMIVDLVVDLFFDIEGLSSPSCLVHVGERPSQRRGT